MEPPPSHPSHPSQPPSTGRRIVTRGVTAAASAGANEQPPLSNNTENSSIDDFDLNTYLAEVQHSRDTVERTTNEQKALDSLDITKKHYQRANKLEKSFLNGIASIGKSE